MSREKAEIQPSQMPRKRLNMGRKPSQMQRKPQIVQGPPYEREIKQRK